MKISKPTRFAVAIIDPTTDTALLTSMDDGTDVEVKASKLPKTVKEGSYVTLMPEDLA